MRWYYKIIERTSEYVRYAYSHESKNCDGVVIYEFAAECAEKGLSLHRKCIVFGDNKSSKF